MFVKDIDAAFHLKLFFERFSINASVLNSELSHQSRVNVIQAFNRDVVNIVIATDEGFEMDSNEEISAAALDEVKDSGDVRGKKSLASRKKTLFDQNKKQKKQNHNEDQLQFNEDEVNTFDEQDCSDGDLENDAESDFGEDMSDISNDDEQKSNVDEFRDVSSSEADDMEEGDIEDFGMAAFENEINDKSKKSIEKMKRKNQEQFSLIRGLDFKNVGTVLNVDMPSTLRSYVHRVGRTARGHNDGVALSLVEKDDE